MYSMKQQGETCINMKENINLRFSAASFKLRMTSRNISATSDCELKTLIIADSCEPKMARKQKHQKGSSCMPRESRFRITDVREEKNAPVSVAVMGFA